MSQEFKIRLCNVVKLWKDLKVPYQHRGMTRYGCDCTGLIIGALKEMGYGKNYQLRIYPPDWNLHSGADNHIVEEISRVADRIERPGAGDLVLFYFGRCIAHIGVIIENGLFIHCHRKSKRCVVSSLWNSPWTKRIFKDANNTPVFYRLIESKLNGV